MGLDMYALVAKPRNADALAKLTTNVFKSQEAGLDFTQMFERAGRDVFITECNALFDVSDLHRWRKHPNLHGWMELLFVDKLGIDHAKMPWNYFNQRIVQLNTADLDALEWAVREKALPETQGFFFGESDGSEKEDDLAFIAKAQQAIDAGNIVFYDSWW